MINQIKDMLTKMTPEQVATLMTGNNQMVANLIRMGKEGNEQGVENFARNVFREQGRDFDKEFSEFRKMFK